MHLRVLSRLSTLALPLAIFAAGCGGGVSSVTASTIESSRTDGVSSITSRSFAAAFRVAARCS
jgi:hypothetical protein